MKTLDKRYSEKTSQEGGTVAKKVRKISAMLTKSPPVDAPQWTVSQGRLSLLFLIIIFLCLYCNSVFLRGMFKIANAITQLAFVTEGHDFFFMCHVTEFQLICIMI